MLANGAGFRLDWAGGSEAAKANVPPIRNSEQKRMKMFMKATRTDYTSLPNGLIVQPIGNATIFAGVTLLK